MLFSFIYEIISLRWVLICLENSAVLQMMVEWYDAGGEDVNQLVVPIQ